MRIGKTFRFEAAHSLPNHDGKCRRPHGHSYIVEVVLRGEVEREPDHPKQGMVLDFSVLGEIMRRRVIDRLDHQDLNVVLAGEVPVTTAENIALWIMAALAQDLVEDRAIVESVKVWETATSWAEASADNPGDWLQ